MVRSVIVLTATSIILVAACALTVSSEASIQQAAESISANAAPSIEILSEARSELRNFQRLFDDYVDAAGEGRRPDRRGVDASVSRLDADLREYLELPSYPGEREAFASVASTRAQMEELINEIHRLIEQHEFKHALAIEKNQLDPLAELLVARTTDLVELNAREVRLQALEVSRIHRRTTVLALGVGISAFIVLGFVSVWSILRIRREHAALEHARNRAEVQAESLDNYSGMVAHDVLSPLTGTLLALSLAERLHPSDETLRRYVHQGRSALTQTMSLVNGLLEFSRGPSHVEPSQPLSVRETTQELVEAIQPECEESGIELRYEPKDDVVIAMSKGVYSSVFNNLTRNAIKYMSSRPERIIWVRVAKADGQLTLEVEDTGPGIPAGMENAIFEPYVRGPNEHQAGFGIGLATVKRLVHAHGGEIHVARGSRGGALFRVQLPTVAPNELRQRMDA